MKRLLPLLGLLAIGSLAWSQQTPDFLLDEPGSVGEGWAGFTDFGFMANSLLTLVLAAALGAVIAYHPRHRLTADTLEELEAPKVYIVYAVIGGLIGIMVVKYGLVIGFVLFGIGGLMRFRTVLRSASLTGYVIFSTLIGLTAGLDLPHVAVLATAFAFVLIFVLDARFTYRMDVKGLPARRMSHSAAAYRAVLEAQGCQVVSERKDPDRERLRFIFRSSRSVTTDKLERQFEEQVDATLKGSIDWQID